MPKTIPAITFRGQPVRLLDLKASNLSENRWRVTGHDRTGLGVNTVVTDKTIRTLPARFFGVDWAPHVTLTFTNPLDISALVSLVS